MIYSGLSIQRAIRVAYKDHRRAPSSRTIVVLAKLRALRALYESSVHARITLPGLEAVQRPLREATECYRLMRKQNPHNPLLPNLQRSIAEARTVPMDLPLIDFTS